MRLLAAAALTLASVGTAVVATAPAQAADTGTLHVTVLDEHGDPMPGSINFLGGTGVADQANAVSETTKSLAPGNYAVMSLSPWGGMLCAGMSVCDFSAIAGGAGTPDGSVQVAAGQTTEVVIRARKPVALKGPARVGKEIAVTFSPGMKNLLDYFGVVGGGLYTPAATWLRDGKAIAGAGDYEYVPTSKDAGHDLSVQLVYPGAAQTQFQYLTGQPTGPRQTGSVAVAQVPTKAFVTLPRSSIGAAQRGGVRVDVTSSGQIVTGKVVITVGGWKTTLPLRNGSARVRLPQLKPGSYAVGASYLGTSTYDSAKAKAKTLTVTR